MEAPKVVDRRRAKKWGMIDIIKFHIRFKKCPICKHYIPRTSKEHCSWCGQKIGERR